MNATWYEPFDGLKATGHGFVIIYGKMGPWLSSQGGNSWKTL